MRVVHDGYLTALSLGQHRYYRSATMEPDQNPILNPATIYGQAAKPLSAQPNLEFYQNLNQNSLST